MSNCPRRSAVWAGAVEFIAQLPLLPHGQRPTLQVLVDVHPLMQDPYDNDGSIGLSKIDHERPNRCLEISWPHMIGGSDVAQPIDQSVAALLDFAEVAQCLTLSPALKGEVKNMVNVRARRRRELQPQDYARAFSLM